MAKSEKDKTFENLPIFVAEYIKLVIKNMGYRKKAREEVQDELIDHFEAALKDCANEQEKQKKANRMIAEFGDAKLLGCPYAQGQETLPTTLAHRHGKDPPGHRRNDNTPDSLHRVVPHRQTHYHHRLHRPTQQARPHLSR